MKLNDSQLKNYKVSILLKQKRFIEKEKNKTERLRLKYHSENKKSKINMNQLLLNNNIKPLNLFLLNNANLSDINKSFPKDNTSKNERESFRNIQVQTTFSLSYKKFKTPYQILKLKNKLFKNIFEYSKYNHQNSYIKKEVKEIDIRPYTAYKEKGRTKKVLLSPQINKLNLNKTNFENNKDNFFIQNKTINKNKIIRYNFSHRKISSNNKEDYNNSIKDEKKIDFFKDKNILKIKQIKPLKANFYYNKLNLDKLNNILKKYSYKNT